PTTEVPVEPTSPMTGTRVAPLLVEGAWRPSLGELVTLHLGLGGGLCLIDTQSAVSRTVASSLRGEMVLGASFAAGPGEVEGWASLGVDAPLGASRGLSWGAGGHLAYRLSL
ncbi:MAG: hypothetical protein ACO3JL_09895, partial [Myxococcota bacterium]